MANERFGRLLLLAATLTATLPDLGRAQQSVIRRGGEFVVNSYTYGGQRRVDVSSAPDGKFVVVWQSFYNNPPDNQFDILAQRYDANGGRAGGEIEVTADPNAQDRPSVGVAADGSFVVVWEDYEEYGGGYRIAARRFGSAGAPLGAEFQVNTTPGTYYNTAIATGADGSFVVAWASYYGDVDGDQAGVFARRFDAAGAPLGNDFQVNTFTSGFQDVASITRAADGSFTIVWQDAYRETFVARRFDGAGAPLTGELIVTASPVQYPDATVAGAPDGRFVVVWRHLDADVAGQRFDAAGAPVGGEFVVNDVTTGYQGRPDVTMAPDGSFVVAWMGDGGGPYSDVFARRFDAAGAPEGGDFQVNLEHSANPNYRAPLAVTSANDGSFVVVWRSAYDYGGGYSDIIGQRFADGTVGCTPAPRLDCGTQTAPAGVFRFKDSANDKRDVLVWQWPKGQAIDLADFGDPLSNDAVALCVYDGSAAPQPIARLVSTAQGPCRNGALCWMALSNGAVLRYFDGDLKADGLQQILLRAGGDGQARLSVRAKGENLTLPATPLTAPVTVQLHASAGPCFTATYQGAIKANGAGEFRAKPDAP